MPYARVVFPCILGKYLIEYSALERNNEVLISEHQQNDNISKKG